MKKNKFDAVMDYIDENILENIELIKIGISRLTGYNINTFSNCFVFLTNETLFHYINTRKMSFAAQTLISESDRSISDIALEYGYSEQSAFSRAFKTYCESTPNDVRNGKDFVSRSKYCLNDVCSQGNKRCSRFQRIIQNLIETGDLPQEDWNYFEQMEVINEVYGFSVEIYDAISDLADKLDVPFWSLLRKCGDLYQDIHSDPNFLSPRIEKAIDCGIQSDTELKKVCDFYDYKLYELDSFTVDKYRKKFK